MFQSFEDSESLHAGNTWVEKHSKELNLIDQKGYPKVVNQNLLPTMNALNSQN